MSEFITNCLQMAKMLNWKCFWMKTEMEECRYIFYRQAICFIVDFKEGENSPNMVDGEWVKKFEDRNPYFVVTTYREMDLTLRRVGYLKASWVRHEGYGDMTGEDFQITNADYERRMREYGDYVEKLCKK